MQPLEGNRAIVRPGEAMKRSHFLTTREAPTPGCGQGGMELFNFRENQSEKSGPEACDGGRGEQCQGVPTGAEIFGSKRVGGGLKTSLEGG